MQELELEKIEAMLRKAIHGVPDFVTEITVIKEGENVTIESKSILPLNAETIIRYVRMVQDLMKL